ncbi:MAG TPA: PilZ domain-containing protein [Smithella sp.]|nr:PilZ domain-containing protein [Smithella sp.]HRS97667.1 PilZ domain-containing protein [Smithella sp.]
MQEKRRMPRIRESNEVTITIIADRKKPVRQKTGATKDISASGVRIQTDIFLPVDALLNVDLSLKKLEKKINALGKVRWTRMIVEEGSYEAGVEFVNAPVLAIQLLRDYIRRIISGRT